MKSGKPFKITARNKKNKKKAKLFEDYVNTSYGWMADLSSASNAGYIIHGGKVVSEYLRNLASQIEKLDSENTTPWGLGLLEVQKDTRII